MQTVFLSSGAIRRWHFTLVALVFGAAGLPALAACPSEPGRFVPNGAEVTDTRTGLIWARCSVGQTWTGHTCAGEAARMIDGKAFEYAVSLDDWRLPNRKELFSLVDKGCINPAIDGTVFPNTYASWYWTTTPYRGASNRVWAVSFKEGGVSDGSRTYHGGFPYVQAAVRLVRSSW